MTRYVCIHGHFYQPPRENPWLDVVERQPSSAPFHDWNERIAVECYAANGAARILDKEERIDRILNNYALMSFNFGPTLLAWLERRRPDVLGLIREADTASLGRFSGHGSAIAQVYNHMILPLANARDRRTQVLWGIADFQHRFGRAPEGMWLPETAVDVASLEALAEAGIAFTILSPHQAKRVRPLDGKKWKTVDGEKIDPTAAYRGALPSGREIALFFYDGPISRAVAFEPLLSSGAQLVERLRGAFSKERSHPQLVHVASDGETYGHHHRFGEMALAFALEKLEKDGSIRLTNYGEFLEKHPPTHSVEIAENTAWSCAHGVERWRSDCGCRTAAREGWNQSWRAPLRDALDRLRDGVEAPFETAAAKLLKDPWKARDGYIDVLLGKATAREFLASHAVGALAHDDHVRALELMELQRHAMLMYTSCGWFFDDLGGIEAIQNLRYAGRVLELSRKALGLDLEEPFLETLASARSNRPEEGNGRDVFERHVRTAAADPVDAAAWHGMEALLQDGANPNRIHCFEARTLSKEVRESGGARLVYGIAEIASSVTLETLPVAFAALHRGEEQIEGWAGTLQDAAAAAARDRVVSAFEAGGSDRTTPLLEEFLGPARASLRIPFGEVRDRVLAKLLGAAEASPAAIAQGLAAAVRRLAEALAKDPLNAALVERLETAVSLLAEVAETPDLWMAQNVCHAIREAHFEAQAGKAGRADEARAARWAESFRRLARALSVRVD
jgi:alpha-amylase/alpha-mannosidase (GH57 family)